MKISSFCYTLLLSFLTYSVTYAQPTRPPQREVSNEKIQLESYRRLMLELNANTQKLENAVFSKDKKETEKLKSIILSNMKEAIAQSEKREGVNRSQGRVPPRPERPEPNEPSRAGMQSVQEKPEGDKESEMTKPRPVPGKGEHGPISGANAGMKRLMRQKKIYSEFKNQKFGLTDDTTHEDRRSLAHLDEFENLIRQEITDMEKRISLDKDKAHKEHMEEIRQKADTLNSTTPTEKEEK